MVDNGGMSHSSGTEALMQPLKSLFRGSLLSAQEGCVSHSQTLPEPGRLSASARVSVGSGRIGEAQHPCTDEETS